ncbi:unnamed protein product [Kuraishia capsulata CBS 1993]|uniref:D-arabinono-1,4-lactone oxidase n=1 Tax=Kuraishia capsulata CBS 1993 TaxID=1382522 RepID=W6MVN2_9ASCO|nr:uncharacterized protein KUCA_T00006007001 [Kuraishia capsulata CBS 1993]CDK30012.1 unnamed protein product [Kuraishia capsulata CBS 1993]
MSVSNIPASVAAFAVPRLFHNTWAKTFICYPQAYFQPRDEAEIVELVKTARQVNKTIMVVGSGHSPSDITMTKDWVVNLDRYSRVLKVAPHESGKYTDVTVEAGMRIYQLNEFLAKKGLAIQNLGSISEQSVAGIISTGTHGASPFHGLVSQQVVDLTVVNGKGEVVKCSPTLNQSLFRAALLSLGKIGLISQVTLRTVPRYQIKSRQEIISFQTLLENWDSIWTSDEFIRVWWFAYADKCVVWRASKSSDPLSEPRKSWYGTRWGRLFYESLLWVSVHVAPRLTPYVERFIFSRQYGTKETLGQGEFAVQESVAGLNMDCLFSQFVNEWAAPLTNGPEILRSLDNSIKEAARRNQFYVHAPIEVRCSNTTSSGSIEDPDVSQRGLIHPGPVVGNNLRPLLDNTPQLAYVPQDSVTNSQLTLYINATMYRPFYTSVPIGKWYSIFEETLEAAGGKPHWAKNFIGSESLASQQDKRYKDGEMKGFAYKMEEWFGEDLHTFKKVRAENDPDGVFLSGLEWAVRNGIVDEPVE